MTGGKSLINCEIKTQHLQDHN